MQSHQVFMTSFYNISDHDEKKTEEEEESLTHTCENEKLKM